MSLLASTSAAGRLGLIITLLLLTACGGESSTPITGCESSGEMTPDCRFQNPEDIALLPDGETVIVSQFGTMDGSKPGSLVTYSLADGHIETVFPGPHDDDRRWGADECPPPETSRFSPHGLDLQQRDDGRWMLLVVNHGGRESVEFFEVVTRGDEPSFSWRGCAEGPPGAYFNDVVGASSGGFWVTHMMPKDRQTWSLIKGLVGLDTGQVYKWQPASGFSMVPGSTGPMPNGIEKSADEATLFINMYLGDEVRKLDLARGKVIGVTAAAGPDNVTWSDDGHLLVASHTAGLGEVTDCQELTEGACGFEYEVVRIDPDDMSRTTLLRHRGPPLGGVTVATDLGNELILGTFAGDRVVRVPDPSP